MPRVRPHHHPCQDCGTKTECPGTWEQNYDGEPEVICKEFHQLNPALAFDRNPDFVCDECAEKREVASAADMAVS